MFFLPFLTLLHQGFSQLLHRNLNTFTSAVFTINTALFFCQMHKCLASFILATFFWVAASGQQISRVRCDFSVKTKVKDKAASKLVLGTCYYDVRIGRLIYDIRFPEKERWIFTDSTQWIVRNDSVIEVLPASIRPELSVMHLSLKQELSHYGLKNSSFTVSEVKQEQGLVITTWEPPTGAAKKMGKVATSTKNKQLQGVLFYHPKGQIIRKQFYKNYIILQGLPFPTEVIDIVYEEGKEIWQQTTYSNVILNDTKNTTIYNYMPRFFPAGKKPVKK